MTPEQIEQYDRSIVTVTKGVYGMPFDINRKVWAEFVEWNARIFKVNVDFPHLVVIRKYIGEDFKEGEQNYQALRYILKQFGIKVDKRDYVAPMDGDITNCYLSNIGIIRYRTDTYKQMRAWELLHIKDKNPTPNIYWHSWTRKWAVYSWQTWNFVGLYDDLETAAKALRAYELYWCGPNFE